MTTHPNLSSFIVEAERFGLFVAGVTDYAIYMLSPQGIISSWNAGAERFKGYTADEIIGHHFSRFYTAEDKANGLPARALQTAIDKGKFEDEGLRVRKDGSRFWASVVIDPIYDTTGELVGFTKITRDVTERRLANDLLKTSEEQFRLLVQGVTDYAIYMLSVDGYVTNWNSGAQRIKGYVADEVVGTHFSRFYTEQDRIAGFPAKALRAAAAKGGFESEGWRIRKDGTHFWAHVVIDPIKNEAGELIGFAKVTRDVTERRETAALLEKTKESLFQSQKMEALGKLTGGISHDFNNLLSVIANGVALLRMSANNNAIDLKTLDSMERAASRGAILTQQLLSFAKQQPLKQEKQDLNRVITSFDSVLRRALKSSVEFELKLAPLLPAILIDATQIEVAILNLVVNSGDAIVDSGTVTLQTRLVELASNQVSELPSGRYIELSVSDTGEGIPPHIIDRVMEPFFTTKPPGKGTGLGLSQVYGLMQQSHGAIKISSTLGTGTEVLLYLPALDFAETPSISVHKNNKALVVDDQPDVLDMAAELFRTLGYDVFAANNGRDALDVLQRNPDIKLLFSDVVMPGMSGIDLSRSALQLIPDLKIILATGYAPQMANGGNDEAGNEFTVITKPYKIADIVQHLRS
ncbi:MAG: PAS domain S-box protein [Pseudomonadota bacterium]